jgi:hypothetical protein
MYDVQCTCIVPELSIHCNFNGHIDYSMGNKQNEQPLSTVYVSYNVKTNVQYFFDVIIRTLLQCMTKA